MSKTKKELKKRRDKAKATKPAMRLSLPPNKRHKSKKDYKRNNKVKSYDEELD